MVAITRFCIIMKIKIVGIVISNVAADAAPIRPIFPPLMVCMARGRVFIAWLVVKISGEK